MNKHMPDSTTLLQRILDISRKMRECALNSDWESVHEKEESRQALIKRCFPLDGSINNPAQATDSIREIIELDRSVVSLAALAREELESSFGKFKLGRHATHSYTSVEIGR
ncbi:MAG: flagellar protein FliT [Gammaproteobacteria bacterium]|nr:flagellar protein FliT [Gammaproteobacteria bacterium]